MERHRLAILIPAFNEESTISRVVKSAEGFGIPLVVDDGSSDRTSHRAREAGAIVVSLDSNGGYDKALNAGFAEAARIGFEFIITLDADGQHDPASIETMNAALDCGADVVLGVRDKRQRIAERIFAVFTAMRWNIHDPLCGMKAYRMSVYRSLGHFDSYQSIGTELALYAARRRLRIAEVAVQTRARKDKPRFGSMMSANLRILRACARAFL